MPDIVNIITTVAAQHAMDENNVETLLGMFLNTLLELAAMVRQIRDPPHPLPLLLPSLMLPEHNLVSWESLNLGGPNTKSIFHRNAHR